MNFLSEYTIFSIPVASSLYLSTNCLKVKTQATHLLSSRCFTCLYLSANCLKVKTQATHLLSSCCFTCLYLSKNCLIVKTQATHLPNSYSNPFSICFFFLTHHPYCDGLNPFSYFYLQVKDWKQALRKSSRIHYLCQKIKGILN